MAIFKMRIWRMQRTLDGLVGFNGLGGFGEFNGIGGFGGFDMQWKVFGDKNW